MPLTILSSRVCLLSLVAALGACASWNVNAPAPPIYGGMQVSNRQRASSLVDVITIGAPPTTVERAYNIMVSRCQAAEREKARALYGYGITRWGTLVTALLASSASVALIAINEPNSVRFSPQTVSNMRISAIALGGLGAVLSTIHGLAGFDRRIDATRRDLVALRGALDRTRALWPYAASAEQRTLLDTMALTCNKEELFEAIGTVTSSGQLGLLTAKLDETIGLLDSLGKALGAELTWDELRQWEGKVLNSLLALAAAATADVSQTDFRDSTTKMVQKWDAWLVAARAKVSPPKVADSDKTPITDEIAKALSELHKIRDKIANVKPQAAPQAPPLTGPTQPTEATKTRAVLQ